MWWVLVKLAVRWLVSNFRCFNYRIFFLCFCYWSIVWVRFRRVRWRFTCCRGWRMFSFSWSGVWGRVGYRLVGWILVFFFRSFRLMLVYCNSCSNRVMLILLLILVCWRRVCRWLILMWCRVYRYGSGYFVGM